MKRLRIGIISRNPRLVSTGRLILAAKKRGYMVRLIDPMQTHFQISSHGNVISNGEPLPRIDGIIPRVGVQSAGYVLSLVQQLENSGIRCLNTAQSMFIARNKLRTLQALASANIPIPRTVYGSFTVHSSLQIESVGGAPVIIKTLDGSQGVGVMLAQTNAQAESIMDVLKQAHIEFILQEYVHESKGNDIRCFVIGDSVVAAMRRQGSEGEFRSNLHRGGIPSIHTLSANDHDMAIRAAKAVGLSVAGVDMIPSETGMKVIEVNCSPGLEGIENTLNIDIAKMIIDHLAAEIRSTSK
jgi:ribosomal protein S6--L-glutamate ligase